MEDMGLYEDEVADVLNYILNSWGNKYDKIITEEYIKILNNDIDRDLWWNSIWKNNSSNKISEYLTNLNFSANEISLDNYYKDLSDKVMKKDVM